MSDFPKESKIGLAEDPAFLNKTVTITGDNTTGFTLTVSSQTWTFPPGANNDSCTLKGGTMPGSTLTLEVQGSCTQTPMSTFLYLIGITRNSQQPPDNHVIEWVSEDEG